MARSERREDERKPAETRWDRDRDNPHDLWYVCVCVWYAVIYTLTGFRTVAVCLTPYIKRFSVAPPSSDLTH